MRFNHAPTLQIPHAVPTIDVVGLEQQGLGFDLLEFVVASPETASAVGRHVRDALAGKIDGVEESPHRHRHAPAPDRVGENDRFVFAEVGKGGLEGRAGISFPFLFRA